MILNYSNCVTPISSPFCFNGTVDSEADEDQSSLSEARMVFVEGGADDFSWDGVLMQAVGDGEERMLNCLIAP